MQFVYFRSKQQMFSRKEKIIRRFEEFIDKSLK